MIRVQRRALVLGLVGFVGALTACASIAGLADLEVADCKGGVCTDASIDKNADTGGDVQNEATLPNDCPGSAGPVPVRVGPDAGGFCVDSTEVTYGQYRKFLDAKFPIKGQLPECDFNDSYATNGVGADDEPVTNVDWCDAVAFCRWAGKRLCGRIGGGTLQDNQVIDFSSNQWLFACGAGGRQNYPYGTDFDPAGCNVMTDAGTKPVGTTSGCKGGFPGLSDMVGNVWEWIDTVCDPPPDAGADAADAGLHASELCSARGGSFANPGGVTPNNLNCKVNARVPRGRQFNDVGFRCCSQ